MTDQPTNCITFNSPPTEEVLRIDKEGFHYKGQFIADAGEAHRLMVEFLRQNTKPEPQELTDEDIYEWGNSVFLPSLSQSERLSYPVTDKDLRVIARAVLARWGCQ